MRSKENGVSWCMGVVLVQDRCVYRKCGHDAHVTRPRRWNNNERKKIKYGGTKKVKENVLPLSKLLQHLKVLLGIFPGCSFLQNNPGYIFCPVAIIHGTHVKRMKYLTLSKHQYSPLTQPLYLLRNSKRYNSILRSVTEACGTHATAHKHRKDWRRAEGKIVHQG